MGRLALSVILGFVLGVCSLYVALEIGFAVGVAYLTAFAWSGCHGLMRRCSAQWPGLSGPDYACYMALTSGMSYSSVTIIATSLSAMLLQGTAPASWAMIVWVMGLGGLGSCLAWALAERLLAAFPFPSGQVSADLVGRLDSEGGARPFFLFLGASALWQTLTWCALLPDRFGRGNLGFANSPMLIGLGAILGPMTTASMLSGALFFYGFVPSVRPLWSDHLLWFATGLLVSATLVSFAGMWRRGTGSEARPEAPSAVLLRDPLYKRVCVLSVLLIAVSYLWGWSFSPLWLLLILPLTIVFAYTTGVVTGQTDIVPTGALGKLSIFAFSLIPHGGGPILAHTGTLTGAAAAGADFLTDLRCGQRLGASPGRQFRFQLLGTLLGPLMLVPLFLTLTNGPRLEQFAVPAARIWLNVVGLGDAMHSHGLAIVAGLLIGLLWQPLVPFVPRLPRPLPFAMAALLDGPTCATLALGGLLGHVIERERALPAWSAMICAEAVLMVGFGLWH